MNPIDVFFHWPNGGIWSNILASILWTTPSFVVGFVIGHFKMKKHINTRHEELKAHITAEHVKSRKLEKKMK